jgi:hypothetical protein
MDTVTVVRPLPHALIAPFPFLQVTVYVGTATPPVLTRVSVPLMTDTLPVPASTRNVPVLVGLDCTTLPMFGSPDCPAESEMVAAATPPKGVAPATSVTINAAHIGARVTRTVDSSNGMKRFSPCKSGHRIMLAARQLRLRELMSESARQGLSVTFAVTTPA